MSVLKLENVSKKLGKKIIIEDINFELNEGEVFGLVGPNGAGKSTLIKTMLGLYKPTNGTILINGFDVQKRLESALANVGAIIENPEVYEYMTAKQNLKVFARMYGKVDKKYIDELLKLVKLEDRANHRVKTYSLGMKQRLGVAIALLSKPNLLVLDEPTNGLDPIGIKELRELIQRLAKENGTTVFISSHILSEIELVCNKIAIIDNGKIVEIINPKEKKDEIVEVSFLVDDVNKAIGVLEQLQVSYRIENTNILINCTKDIIPSINLNLSNSGILIYEIKTKTQTLEDEFVKVTTGSKGQLR